LPAAQRSAVSNGTRHHISADGRTAWNRRRRDLIDGHICDKGGPDHISEGELSLIKRTATLEVQLEQLEARLSENDESVDLDVYNRLCGNLRRCLETLGLKRVAKQVNTVNITEYRKMIDVEAAE
jgi:hypothetical protein